MPAEGLEWQPSEDVLKDDEVIRLIRIGVTQLGIQEVRFTGGEPLLRRGLPMLVRRAKELQPTAEVSLTTNGLGLDKIATSLAEAGLDRINISLDSVRAGDFHTITRRDRLEDVLAGISAAQAAGLSPVKINAVLLRGINDDQAVELLDWCISRNLELRFVEQMPLDAQHSWSRAMMITAKEILRHCRPPTTWPRLPNREEVRRPSHLWLMVDLTVLASLGRSLSHSVATAIGCA